MTKPCEGWAVVDTAGRMRGLGFSQVEAWEAAGENDSYPTVWLELRKDYRCIRVRIVPVEEPDNGN